MHRQGRTAGLKGVGHGTGARSGLMGLTSSAQRAAGGEVDRTVSCGRKTAATTKDTLIKIDVGLGPLEQAPVWYRLRSTSTGVADGAEAPGEWRVRRCATPPSRSWVWTVLRSSLFAMSLSTLGRQPSNFAQHTHDRSVLVPVPFVNALINFLRISNSSIRMRP